MHALRARFANALPPVFSAGMTIIDDFVGWVRHVSVSEASPGGR
ncbi:MAG: hypothetical protein AAF630_12530 [Cyanobacteria bacterium P01_C01_bin.38]